MKSKKIYLDYSATTPLLPEILEEMVKVAPLFGNPSSIHQIGQKSNSLLDQCRDNISHLLGCQSSEIIFTGGATESNNLILQGIALQANNNYAKEEIPHFIISPLEHSSIRETAFFLEKSKKIELSLLPVDKTAIVKLEDIEKLIKKNTQLISITTASSEVGTIQPIAEITALAKQKNIFFHTDAVQSVGTMGLRFGAGSIGRENSPDSVTLSSHKIYGPKGVGLLYLKTDASVVPISYGGGQEGGYRAGTENLMGILGFSKALEYVFREKENYKKQMQELSNLLDTEIEKNIPEAILTGDKEKRLCFHRNYIFPNCSAAQLLMHLDLNGICVSSGSACSSGRAEPSFALTKMGYSPEESSCSLRISMGLQNSKDDILFFVDALKNCLKSLRDC